MATITVPAGASVPADAERRFFVAMAVLFVAAIAQARRPDAHSRLMLLVTLVALNPALARIVGMFTGTQGVRNAIVGGVLVLALIGVAVARDRLVRGRIHPAYLRGGGFLLALQLARATLHDSRACYAAADAPVALAH